MSFSCSLFLEVLSGHSNQYPKSFAVTNRYRSILQVVCDSCHKVVYRNGTPATGCQCKETGKLRVVARDTPPVVLTRGNQTFGMPENQSVSIDIRFQPPLTTIQRRRPVSTLWCQHVLRLNRQNRQLRTIQRRRLGLNKVGTVT